MENIDIIKYRKKHHKCKWCKYCTHISGYAGGMPFDYNTCELKDKMIYFTDYPTLCRYYRSKIKRRIEMELDERILKDYEEWSKIKNLPTKEQFKDIKKEWDEITEILFNNWDKEEILIELKDMWTLLNKEMSSNKQVDQWNYFLGYLSYCSDRMNVNRWCRLQLLLGNAISH